MALTCLQVSNDGLLYIFDSVLYQLKLDDWSEYLVQFSLFTFKNLFERPKERRGRQKHLIFYKE